MNTSKNTLTYPDIMADDILSWEKILLRATVIFCAAVLLLSVIFGVLPTEEDTQIYDKILRLHVIANSDSESDQRLKLEVRDSVLRTLGTQLESCSDLVTAESIARTESERIRLVAEQTLQSHGCPYPVSVEIGKEYYPTRYYEGVSLPAGTYNSVRIVIGEGNGKNWWCILFPALCTSAAAKPEEQFTDAGFTPGQIDVLTESEKPKYVLRFRFLEILGSLFSRGEEE